MAKENWGVTRTGGSIGEGKHAKYYGSKHGLLIKSGLTRSEAKILAARRRKQLSPGERSYCKMGYSIIEIK